jgi:hypothetical protein
MLLLQPGGLKCESSLLCKAHSCMKMDLLSKLALEVPCHVCYVLSCIIGHFIKMSRG